MVIDQQAVRGDVARTVIGIVRSDPQRMIVVTGESFDVSDVASMMHEGVAYVLTRPMDHSKVATVVDFVLAKVHRLSAAMQEYEEFSVQFSALTQRELDVLNHVLEGTSNREAARILDVSVRTIESRRAKLYRKLHSRSVAEVIRKVDRLATLTSEFKPEGSRVAAIPALAPHFKPTMTTVA